MTLFWLHLGQSLSEIDGDTRPALIKHAETKFYLKFWSQE